MKHLFIKVNGNTKNPRTTTTKLGRTRIEAAPKCSQAVPVIRHSHKNWFFRRWSGHIYEGQMCKSPHNDIINEIILIKTLAYNKI